MIAAAAILGIVLMGFAGLGIDMGYMRYQKRLEQTAADSAALAGAAEYLYSTGTGYNAAAQHDATANGFTNGVNNVTVTVKSPPTSGPHNGVAGYVQVTVAQVQPTFFMSILGIRNETVTARAVATSAANSSGCIYVLGTNSTAISLGGGAAIHANGCGVTDDGGLLVNNGASMAASSVGVVGTSSVAGGSTVTPAPITGIAPASDPLSNYPPPPVGSPCINELPIGTGTTNLNPGTYCSLTIGPPGGNAIVNFSPGVYVVTGNIDITNGATLNGTSGVMFYQTAGTFILGVNGGGVNLNLNPPSASNASTGAIAGILFWQAASDTSNSGATPATVDNNTGNLTGGLYFPNGILSIQGGVSVSPDTILVVKGLTMANGTSLTTNANYTGLTGGSPIKDAVLVE